jgi:predicted phosphoribosyltransferase
MELYRDRRQAGAYLGAQLRQFAAPKDALVLALPRGGVPVGYEVARALDAPLDVFVVRKLGVPGYEELAFGAIAGGARVLNEAVIHELRIDPAQIDAVVAAEEAELRRREALRGPRAPLLIAGRGVILVDDGLATGASMRAAVAALRPRQPSRIVVAVPVGAPESCRDLAAEVDQVVCGATPEPFYGVGMWYRDFTQTSDAEVRELLQRAAERRPEPPESCPRDA